MRTKRYVCSDLLGFQHGLNDFLNLCHAKSDVLGRYIWKNACFKLRACSVQLCIRLFTKGKVTLWVRTAAKKTGHAERLRRQKSCLCTVSSKSQLAEFSATERKTQQKKT